MTIRHISTIETYTVRHPVLRPGRPLEDCKFEGDDDNTTFHLGLFIEEKLVAIVTFMKTNNNAFTSSDQYQLRGMAVLEKFQGLGLGNELIKKGEDIICKKNSELIWLNSREVAVNFYKRNGYRISGSAFNIPKIGLHFMMYKTLN